MADPLSVNAAGANQMFQQGGREVHAREC